MKNWKTWLSLCLITTGIYWLGGCQKGDLTLGDKVVPGNNLNIVLVDTFTVKTSTVAVLDTFVTSADSNVYVGRWRDVNTGAQDFTGYITPLFPSNSLADLVGEVSFDSLVLQMPFRYAYGDTLENVKLSIHQLNEVIESDVYYNNKSFPYNAKPILEKTIPPHRKEWGSLLSIRLPTALGQTLFDGFRNRTITDDDDIHEIIPGFALRMTTIRNLIVGLNTISDNAAIKLYYHENLVDSKAESLDIKLTGPHLSNIVSNYTGTPMAKLVLPSDYVNSTLTGNRSFVLTGGQLRTRLEFPYFDMIKGSDYFVGVNRAELVFTPIRSTTKDNAPPPSTLTLYQLNQNNEITNVVPTTPGGATAVSGSYAFVDGIEFRNNYTFALTAYMQQLMKGQVEAKPLLMNVATSTTLNFSRVALGNSFNDDYQVKLRLYFTTSK
ncbi:MAG: DUF4270 family protein [Siphonobacter aquaeclarae]|nr:DUF4270 family protein [Siphonobacter aquaeclarae]